MENQVPEDVVKRNFNRVLETVQEVTKNRTLVFTGQKVEVLVEEKNEHDENFVTGRMSNNTMVHFRGDESLIGTIQTVHLDECHGFYYTGHVEEMR